ncbi:MAG: OmpA family protein [Pseudomonadota bacterium]
MLFRSIFAAGLAILPQISQADVVQLSINSDYCAIKQAMTGSADPDCPTPEFHGATRSIETAAIPPDGEKGYFIHFAFASDVLTKDYQSHLMRLSAVLKSEELASLCLKLVGHTDAVGSKNYNLSLSQRRARTVRLFLVGVAGVGTDRLHSEGMGEGQTLPGVDSKDPSNRRVEILAREPGASGCKA